MLFKEPEHTKALIYNPESTKYHLLKNGKLSIPKKISFSRDTDIRSFIPNQFIIQGEIPVPLSLSDSGDLRGIIEDKAYEELGLDNATEYHVSFYSTGRVEGDNALFQVYALNKSEIDQFFTDPLKELRCFDQLIPFPFLYTVLYEKKLLSKKENHGFLYLSDNDAVFTYYHNGKPVYSKSMKEFSLKSIHENYKDVIDYDKFTRILVKEGSRSPVQSYQDYFIRVFNQLFIQINDILIFIQRSYGLSSPTTIYTTSSLGPISGLDSYSDNFLSISSQPMTFDLGIKYDGWFIDPPDLLLAAGIDKEFSISLYPRPPVFFKRASGQMFAIALAASIAGLSIPGYYYTQSLLLKTLNAETASKLEKVSLEANKYRAILGKLSREKKSVYSELEKEKEYFNKNLSRLKKIEKMKHGYSFRWAALYRLTSLMNKHHVHLSEIEFQNGTYHLLLVSGNDRALTALVKDVTASLSPEYINLKRIKGEGTDYIAIMEVRFNGNS